MEVCLKCGRAHDVDAETYFKIDGNLYIGSYGGLVGNSFDEAGLLVRSSIFCVECLIADLVAAAIKHAALPAAPL